MFWELELLIDLPLNFPFYLRNFSLPIGQNGSENFTRKKIFIGKTEKMKQKNLQNMCSETASSYLSEINAQLIPMFALNKFIFNTAFVGYLCYINFDINLRWIAVDFHGNQTITIW